MPAFLALELAGGNSVVQGLIINNVAGDGILVTSANNVIRGNMLDGNSRGVVLSDAGSFAGPVTNNTIGGTTPADLNSDRMGNSWTAYRPPVLAAAASTSCSGNLIQNNGTSPHENAPAVLSNDSIYSQGHNTFEITAPTFTSVSNGSFAGNVATVQPGSSVSLTGNYLINSPDTSTGTAIFQAYNAFIAPAPLGAVQQNDPQFGGYWEGILDGSVSTFVGSNPGTFTFTTTAPTTPGTYFIGEAFSYQFNFIPNKIGNFGVDKATGNAAAPFEVVVLPPPLMAGVRIDNGATNNQVAGNVIEQNGEGVDVDNASGNIIGGTSAGMGNLISLNIGDGIDIGGSGATANLVQGNFIGTDAAGAVNESNGGDAVNIQSANNTIGGTVAGAGNVLSGNGVGGTSITIGGQRERVISSRATSLPASRHRHADG